MKIYCTGIGGIGLSAYASLMNSNGHTVVGSDGKESVLTQSLEKDGIQITTVQDGALLDTSFDVVVYSEAIPVDGPERSKASQLGIPQKSYFTALGELSSEYTVIAISGTHGKSSTTGMVTRVLIDLGLDPTVAVGTKLKELGGKNWRKGNSKWFVVEACEYRRSFHNLSPSIVLLLNADGDHFDAYKDVDDYQQAYIEFLQQLPGEGYTITHMSDSDCKKVVETADIKVVDADHQPMVRMKTPGEHMQKNAQLVVELGHQLGLDIQKVIASLAEFTGTWRRMEDKGIFGDNILVIDDYAHHPLEIQASLKALKQKHSNRRLICAFQPHTQNRTFALYNEMCKSFTDADTVLLADVYEVREVDDRKITMKKFANDIANQSTTDAEYIGNLESLYTRINTLVQPNDVIVTMGAGDITNLATKLVQ